MTLSIIYYSSSHLETDNPSFLAHTQGQLLKAANGIPILSVTQKPTAFGTRNICVGDIGKSHLNIYRQILIGAKEADTDYVAMAEDDILYSREHFQFERYAKEEFIRPDMFLYDMNKVSIFTWTKPPMFSFRTKRRVVNQLISPRKMLVDYLEERFKRLEYLRTIMPEERILKYWGDPGRYDDLLGVSPRQSYEFYCDCPSIVFSHPFAFGYKNLGKKKRLGDLRIIELAQWGKAKDILRLYG